MTTLVVMDVETTGLDPEKDRVVEFASVAVSYNSKNGGVIGERTSDLVHPGVPIPPEATAIHHIRDEEVAGRPLLTDVVFGRVEKRSPFIPVAHYAEFDSKFLPMIEGDWICTLRCSRQLWPQFTSYSNQAMRYQLKLLGEPDSIAMPPHRAGPDAYVTAHLLTRMLKNKTPEELVELTKAPILMKLVGFGMHRGQEWASVPKSYLDWILKKPAGEFDRDVVHTARHWRAR